MTDRPRKPMTVRQRKALLALHGITATDIGRAIGRSCSTVTTIINKYPAKKSRVIQEYIAAHTGKTFEQIWGDLPDRRTAKRKIKSNHVTTISDKKRAVND